MYCAKNIIGVLVVLCLLLGSKAVAAPLAQEISAKELQQCVAKEKGKLVLVNIFASWCPPCRDEVPFLIGVRTKYSKEEVAVIGVSIDVNTDGSVPKQSKALQSFMDELHINYPVYLANDMFTQEAGIRAVPSMLVFNRKGELLMNHVGLIEEEDLLHIIQKYK